jgi:hypothetical protein
MRDRTPRARETGVIGQEPTIPAAPFPLTLSPAEDKISQLKTLAERIERHRSELDDYLNEYAKLITPPGVPMVNIRQMIDARGHCICQNSLFAISARVEALELEEKQRGAIPEE